MSRAVPGGRWSADARGSPGRIFFAPGMRQYKRDFAKGDFLLFFTFILFRKLYKTRKHIIRNRSHRQGRGGRRLSRSRTTHSHTTPREDTQQSQTERNCAPQYEQFRSTPLYGSVHGPPSAQLPLASVSSTAGSNTPTALRRLARAPPSSLDGQRAQPDLARGLLAVEGLRRSEPG